VTIFTSPVLQWPRARAAIAVSAGGVSRRRTVILKAPASEIYDRMYRWFSLQEHEIVQEVKNEKLQVKIGGQGGRYILTGIVLVLLAVVPGVLWFIFARGRLTITLQTAPEGTYLSAQLQGVGTSSAFNQLVGVLSMIDSQGK